MCTHVLVCTFEVKAMCHMSCAYTHIHTHTHTHTKVRTCNNCDEYITYK